MLLKNLSVLLGLACWLLLPCNIFAKQFEVPKTLPPFNMLLSDGVTYYNASNIQKNKPLLIIYFDPECQHCRHFTADILKNSKKFSNTQIVMICCVPGLPPLQKFVADFGLAKHANIKVGTEGIYKATLNFYRVSVTPFTAVYNNKAELVKYYRTVPQIQELVMQFSK